MYRYPILVVSQTVHGTQQALLAPLHFHVENAASVGTVVSYAGTKCSFEKLLSISEKSRNLWGGKEA